jgi:hypothetical protein
MTKQFILAIVIVSLLGGTVIGQKKNERPPIPNSFRGADTTAPADQRRSEISSGLKFSKTKSFRILCELRWSRITTSGRRSHASTPSVRILASRALLSFRRSKPAPT